MVLGLSDFESGGLNRPSRIRPNRLFPAKEAASAVIAILNRP
ncbi:MAG: hypothetical protein ACLQU1_02825 [Bryobacteraceae bacterium]